MIKIIVSKMLTVLVGLALLGAVGFGAYSALAWAVGVFAGMDPQVAALTGIASVVMLLAAMVIAGRSARATRPNESNRFGAEKAETYALFIDLWRSRLVAGEDTEDGSPEALSEALRALDRQLILYGAAGVFKAHVALLALWHEGRASQPQGRETFVKALVEIRKDLGLDVQGLTVEALRQLLLPDAEVAGTTSEADLDMEKEYAR